MSLQPHEEHSHLGIMKSKRMQRVVASLTGQVSDSVSQQDEPSAPRKRKRGVQGRGRGRRGGRGRGRGRVKGKEEHDEASDMEEAEPKVNYLINVYQIYYNNIILEAQEEALPEGIYWYPSSVNTSCCSTIC